MKMIRTFNLLICFWAIFFSASCTPSKDVYLFSYFIGNGEDGLHFAYSYDGLRWEALNNGKSYLSPQVGKDRLMRDPSICVAPDGTFYMVWTSGWWDQIIGYAWSKDLINWSEQKEIPVMMHEPEAKNSWAPELFYDNVSGLYYIFWATTIPGRHSEVAESERERGLNHRIYYTTTKDFQTFADTRMMFNPDFSVIDAAAIRWNGEYILFLKNENPNPPEKNIRYTKNATMGENFPVEVSAPITGNYWAEGPSPLKVGDYLYVYFDKYRDNRYGAVRSRDGVTWEDVSDQIVFPKGTRHGTAFTVKEETLEKMGQVRKAK
jgi:beta-galactosidase